MPRTLEDSGLPPSESPPTPRPPPATGPSWPRMLALVALGLLVAGAIAYRLVAPFFHPH